MPSQQSTPSLPHTALITGAGTGIGLACAEKFLAEGWNVIALGRRLEPLEKLSTRFPGSRVLPLVCDITKPDQIIALELKLRTEKELSLGAIINNAGFFERHSFQDSDDHLWQETMDVHLFGPVRLVRTLLPYLEKSHGVVINISSTLALRPVPNTSAYSAAKAAMVNWTESLALELGKSQIRVNCICPGIIDTPIHSFHNQPSELEKLGPLQPLGRVGKASDVAHAVWSLAGPGSEWITGSVLKVDGGIHLA